MQDRFCPSCGTEIEGDARFCPSCGTTLSLREDDAQKPPQDAAVLPPAPAWPPPETPTSRSEMTDPDSAQPPWTPAEDELTRAEAPPDLAPEPEPAPPPGEAQRYAQSAAPPPLPPPPAASGRSTPGAGGLDLPITWPTMLSGWLIGGGAVVGALALIPRLGSVVSLLLFLALVGVAATVFLADRVPDVPRQRLAILAVSMVGLGIGLEGAGFSFQGAATVFLVAMLAAAGGALLIELDRDRPMPPPTQGG